ncbi:phage infection protein [Paenibacillus baekrokdamisoli]|uniref:Phage infection protein n=1 Tax=Paenibacillus baekrokdamisoli TaxID=1712516 RepID=A0A3G9IUB7_9BACL|nr:YhgE/Pip domain-containing protein [Paenibacillus baekrokdamisoli]MBB3071638.1 putative membrane protein [Paenibacillus baekrokdamisoli]BBH21852.1 phage infection protein [Paenibacillus baekrokdamisoli]
MKGLSLFGNEISRIVRDRKLLIPIIGILFIPIMYSGMLIGVNWDPYGKLSKLPVAVVNEDAGAQFEGKSLTVGNDLVEQLKEKKDFKWEFVDKAKAEKGLVDGNYYYAIEIPKEFSKQATTLLDKNPQPAALRYVTNDSESYLASKIGQSAITKLQAEISAQVTKSYAEAVFNQIGDAADGIAKASDGATKLSDGASSAKQGAELLRDNVAKLASGTKDLLGGVSQLGTGASSVSDGAAKVSTGAAAMSSGLGKLEAAGKQLSSGADKAAAAGKQLEAGLASAQQGSEQLAAGAAKLEAALDAYVAAQPDAAGNATLQQLLGAAKAVSSGAAELSGGSAKLAAGATQLQQGQTSLQQGLGTLHEKLAEASKSGAQLAAGAKATAAGAAKVASGAVTASHGAAKLADGSGKLATGSAELASGTKQLADGSAELSGKLGDASRQSGDITGSDALYDMFAKPVQVDETKLTEVPNYGTGFTPYFLSLGLFVGALLSTMVMSFRETTITPRSSWSWFLSKALLFGLVGVVQALIADAILLYGIGLHVNHMAAFIGFTLLTSVTFMMIIQFLVAAFDQPGRFIGVILLILQLTGSGGTYPSELVPTWLSNIREWLPMTYTISAFREIVTGNELLTAGSSAFHVALFAIVSAALSLVVYTIMFRKNKRTAATRDVALSA